MEIKEAEMTLILRALKFAALKHRDQRRKDPAATPYINHPISVMEMLWDIAGVREIEVLVAALLHDTLEDTATTPQELETLFGTQVLALVQEVSDDKSLPRDVRKQLQVEHAADHSPGARLIKIADKTCNVHDIGVTPPPNWSIERRRAYLEWSYKVIAGMRGTHPALEAEFDRVLEEAQQQVEKQAALLER